MEFSSTYDPGPEVEGGEVLALHRNENLFVGREWTVDAARERIEEAAIATYPDATSLPVREALAEVYGVRPGNVFVGNGSDEVLSDLFALLRPRYDALHVLDVHFKVYPLLAERLGFRLARLGGDTFTTRRVEEPDFHGLAVVDSPNGITGARLPDEDLRALAANDDAFLIWDNVYGEYAGDELPDPLPSNVAFVRSFSKFYGLAGLRVGYGIADEALVSELLARKDAFNVNGFAQAMALEALRRKAWFEELRDRFLECRVELVRRLEGLGFRVLPSHCIAVLATHPEHPAEDLQRALLARGVAVRRFTDPETANFVRMTVAPLPVIERLTRVLEDVVGG